MWHPGDARASLPGRKKRQAAFEAAWLDDFWQLPALY
jgi:hypothetical protein